MTNLKNVNLSPWPDWPQAENSSAVAGGRADALNFDHIS